MNDYKATFDRWTKKATDKLEEIDSQLGLKDKIEGGARPEAAPPPVTTAGSPFASVRQLEPHRYERPAYHEPQIVEPDFESAPQAPYAPEAPAGEVLPGIPAEFHRELLRERDLSERALDLLQVGFGHRGSWVRGVAVVCRCIGATVQRRTTCADSPRIAREFTPCYLMHSNNGIPLRRCQGNQCDLDPRKGNHHRIRPMERGIAERFTRKDRREWSRSDRADAHTVDAGQHLHVGDCDTRGRIRLTSACGRRTRRLVRRMEP